MKKTLLICLLLLSSCAGSKNTSDETNPSLVDLVESTHIIRTLIHHNQFSQLLQEHDKEQLALLLDNFSPAQFAFESEVKASTIPLVVVYYFKDSPEEKAFIQQLRSLAQEYDNRVKFVIIDVEKLFTLAQDAEIDTLPTAILVKNNDVIATITDTITIDSLENIIQRTLNE